MLSRTLTKALPRLSSNPLSAIRRYFSDEKEFRARCPEGVTPADNFGTMALHAGQEPDPIHGSRVPPIYMNTGFIFKDAQDAASKFALQAFGPIYTRIGNPTNDALEKKVAALEGGMAALCVASGHGAQMTAFSNLLNSGDNFISTNKLYGGSYTQFTRQFKQFGWEVRMKDQDDFEGIAAAIDSNTKAIYCESIANPGGIITDVEALSSIAKSAGIPLIVDNTTASPYLIRPFEWGADVVIHSATKFLGGHGNALGGVIVEKGDFDWLADSEKFPIIATPCESYHGLNFAEVFGKDGPVAEMFGTKGKTGMAFAIAARALGLRDMGACISPMNTFLIQMGIETLHVRMERHCANATALAEFLNQHPKIEWVKYAGLESDPGYKLHQKYCPKGAGSLFTFGVKGGYEAAKTVVDSVQMFSLVANLGDTRSLIAHPASMMHSQLGDEAKKTLGAPPDCVRVSVGIEEIEDIIADMDLALSKL
ncbi:hypothetical protein AAMO2058_001133500 [Amorphochlora amoebiformis]